MDCTFSYLAYRDTNAFSQLVTDYLDDPKKLAKFYKYTPDQQGVAQAIKDRTAYPVDRATLVETLTRQYKHIEHTDTVADNIAALANDNTFTICTAHQPNLLTGYLYFIYKIAHAIKLAEELNSEYPDKHFVPVYYMGSEDNDLDELGVFRYNDDQYRWDANGQQGAVGRMDTKSLKPLLNDLFRVLGPPSDHTEEIKDIITHAYLKHNNISEATQYLVNALFGKYGLLVLNPDEASFKKSFTDVMLDDLTNHEANGLVTKQVDALNEQGYKSQAYPRDINIFYLTDSIRERIEKDGDEWVVLNTDIKWDKTGLKKELAEHPERFSPNVILRGVFQETIMPNVAFIGGGAEVAYWMQLKTVFEHYSTFYPVILPRQSVLWVDQQTAELAQKLGLGDKDLFRPTDELIKEHIEHNANTDWETKEELDKMTALILSLQQKAEQVDPTLKASAGSVLAKVTKQLRTLEQKMLRAEKRKMDVDVKRIEKLKAAIYPSGGLQERKLNFLEYYPIYGTAFVDIIKEGTKPYCGDFLIVTEK